MSQALYRKYRSKNLSEIVGQEHITKTLENALKTGKISHAYLFTGPRGVGKTSIARILAHEINELPYTDESMHLDIVEIDAASNRRIDEIRDLREKVHIAPTSAKYKVYIIDEVHMLTKEAFNALLKTLEEPPAHVVFILATTELHKLPETIVSRTQRFTFKLIDDQTVVSHLKEIAQTEGIDIEDDALELLAVHGKGSFRDSISLLDQVGHSKSKVNRADTERLIGIATSEHIELVLGATLNGSPAEVLSSLDKLSEDGVSPTMIAKQLSAVIRKQILKGNSNEPATKLLGKLLQVGSSSDPAGKLESVLLDANLAHNPSTQQVTIVQTQTKPQEIEQPAAVAPVAAPEIEEPAEIIETEISKIVTGDVVDWWNEVLTQIKGVNNTLYGIMRMATPTLNGDVLQLGFKFKLHVKKANEADTQDKLHKAIEKVTGKAYQISAFLGDAQAASPEPQNVKKDEHLDSVKNIFGGGEVLES